MDDAWKVAKVTPARPADDAEWMRRVYLDLAGRIPSVAEARSFLKDRRTDRRQRLVESLLAGQRYPTYFASIWRNLLTPEANDTPRIQAPPFEAWLRDWLASDRGYDWMVRELLEGRHVTVRAAARELRDRAPHLVDRAPQIGEQHDIGKRRRGKAWRQARAFAMIVHDGLGHQFNHVAAAGRTRQTGDSDALAALHQNLG